MVVGILLLLFTFKSFSNEVLFGGSYEYDPNDPPIDFLVDRYIDSDEIPADELLSKIFNKGELKLYFHTDEQTYNLNYDQQSQFVRQYLMKIAKTASGDSVSHYHKDFKRLAKSTYATNLNYNFIDRVQELYTERKDGVEMYKTLLSEGHDLEDIKRTIQDEILSANAYSGWDNESLKRDELLKYLLENDLGSESFFTAQFEEMINSEGIRTSAFGVMGEPGLKSTYSELLKKVALHYDSNSEHPMYGSNFLCRTLSGTSILSSETIEGNGVEDDRYRKRRIVSSFNTLSRKLAALSEFGKDITNNNEKCFGTIPLSDYIDEFKNNPYFDHDDPNFIHWFKAVSENENRSNCEQEKLNNVIPTELCERDTLLSEATTYLKSIKRTGQNVEHVYGHQINNCLLVLFANLSSVDAASISTDDFTMEIKYLDPKGPDKVVDKIKETRNYRYFLEKMTKRLHNSLKKNDKKIQP